MNKFLRKVIFVTMALILTSCSYKPIFSEKEFNFQIDDVIFYGEKDINKIIKNKLDLIKKNDYGTNKTYNLSIITSQKKLIVSKDSKGNPLKFEMSIVANYEVKRDGKILFRKDIEKNNIYNSNTDKFELEKKEKIILENISDKISEIIISSLINLDDN
tara:strand:- start:10 stop:486 length:477 start_codon:yes stop_codon:yes gene_type:complete